MPRPLQVDATDERMVFLVHSRSNPARVYRVDLTANEGRSECHCPDWRTRQWLKIKAGKPGRCIHVAAAREAFLDDLLRTLSQREESP